MDCPHHLAAAGRDTRPKKQTIKIDPFIAERVALIDADHHRRQAAHIIFPGEARPGQGIPRREGLDSVSHGGAVVVEVQKYAVVLNRRRAVGDRPRAGYIGAKRIEAFDAIEVAILQQLQSAGQGQVPAAAFPGDDDPRRIDLQRLRVIAQPPKARKAVIEPRRIGRHLRNRRRGYGVAKINHDHNHALSGQGARPNPVMAIKARTERHTAAMDVVDAG